MLSNGFNHLVTKYIVRDGQQTSRALLTILQDLLRFQTQDTKAPKRATDHVPPKLSTFALCPFKFLHCPMIVIWNK